jgi:fatty-acyl-CoA synthase
MEANLAEVFTAVEEAFPDRLCVAFRDRELTYHDLGDRSRRLANVLLDAGLGFRTDRSELAGHETGQSHLAVYLHNGNEYLEAMLGSYMARVAPFNVNYRYVAEELEYLLRDAGASAVVYHSAFAPVLDEVRSKLPDLQVLLQVDDDSGNGLLEGARWYEDALTDSSPTLNPAVVESWSPDDLYILYTGGTTGMPKGVLWRQSDIFFGALGGRPIGTPDEFETLEAVLGAAENGGIRMMPLAPFMHGAGHWMAFNTFTGGHSLVLPDVVDHLDPADVLRTIEQHGVNVMLIVGDAFAKPLLEAIATTDRDLSSLLALTSGGAALSSTVKAQLLEALPTILVMDALGSSEAGAQGTQVSGAGQDTTTGDFQPGPGLCILDDSLSRRLEPGDAEIGWLAQAGRVPLGYLGDADKTARTFPVVDGVRMSVPGDRAQLDADGKLLLLGRDSATINSGGEKIFAEEVEAALAGHPAVLDVVVTGRPSDRWGNEVVAIVSIREGMTATDDDLVAHAGGHIARYKLPKEIIRVDTVLRSPSGKADHRWAKSVAADTVAE